ncbi:protein SRC2-like [Salvia splendens]|uniref:protein SRC2-like n=1 Tax=Salvia splendens TaxID=180675 RepID=UPI001C277658|nr:protein SRC2-like [Salvia splendens]
MAGRYQVEVTITSAKDLKNVNWRHGSLKPYAVAWVDPNAKSSTHVASDGDTSPTWDQTLLIPFDSPIEDSTLHVDIVHADDTKPLIGSSRLPLRDVVGLARRADRTLHLTRPSGRPQGKLDVAVSVREPGYRAPPPPAAREYPYVGPYGGAPAYAAPPSGYPAYRAPPPSYGYGQDSFYGGPQQGYVEEEEKKGSKFGGMGTGLAVGAVAGVLGGIALTEGVDALEDHIADDVADDLADEEEDY